MNLSILEPMPLHTIINNFIASFSIEFYVFTACFVARYLYSGIGHLVFDVYILHTDILSQQDSPKRVISLSRRPQPTQHTLNTTDEHLRPQRVSNSRSQQSCGFRLTPQTARSPGSQFVLQRLFLVSRKVFQLLERHIAHTPHAILKLIYILYILPLYVKTCHTFREI